MSCCELELAFLIPKAKSEDLLKEPYVSYKGTDYKKTLRFRLPLCKPVKSRIKRFWHWICFVWLHSRSRKCRKMCFLFLFTIFSLLFTIICVILPLTFKYSVTFQRYIIFNPIRASHDSFAKVLEVHKANDLKTLYKPNNIYVAVADNYKLGVWDISQHGTNSKHSYLIYFHDSNGNRDLYSKDYSRLMPYFHIIAFDYRGYGDSSLTMLNESGLVQDGMQIFKWLKFRTNSSIFVWGDALGASIAAHTVAELKKENLSPCGLILENPFTTMGEELGYSWFIARMNWYMPWYTSTFIDPLKETDLSFSISMYINEIDYPVSFWEWNNYRAKKFDIEATYSYTFKNKAPFFINRVDVPRYIKDQYILPYDENKNYLRNLITAGEKYCNHGAGDINS